MDRVKKLYESYLEELSLEFKEKLESLPTWKLKSYLPSSSSHNKKENIELIQERFLAKDVVYSILLEDLNHLKSSIFEPANLSILSIDDRFLEANGYGEKKKKRVYSFVSDIQKLIKE